MKYRKKPVVIEALQWTGDNYDEVALWMSDRGGCMFQSAINGTLLIPTKEGDMRATVGDWIICGVEREFYPCKPDIFQKTYQPVGPESSTLSEASYRETLGEIERRASFYHGQERDDIDWLLGIVRGLPRLAP